MSSPFSAASSRRTFLRRTLASAAVVLPSTRGTVRAAERPAAPPPSVAPAASASGYRGIWFTLGQRSEHGDKYSGGLGTYTANHVPMAIHAPEAGRTFFVYGGTQAGRRHLLAMASHFDHRTGTVPRPTIVHDKGGVDDPHDNPSLCLDGDGFLWVFVSGRARHRPGLIYRSRRPHQTDAFDLIAEREFTYPQAWWIEGRGFLFLFTQYTRGRELYFSTSPDGRAWTPDRKFAGMGGHYQTSWCRGNRVITAFNRHPGGNVDRRTDLYFLTTDDFGETWRNVQGTPLDLPLAEAHAAALTHDFQADQRLVYIHDLDLDPEGHPAILFTTSADHRSGPPGDPRWWTVGHWNGSAWRFRTVTRANHNYTTGSFEITTTGQFRILGPTEPGPQPLGSGGEVALWTSNDEGATWLKVRDLTRRSPRNHNYVRRALHAHPDFQAFWADGNPDEFSPSALYFTNREGTAVWRLPEEMEGAEATPVVAFPRLAPSRSDG